MNRRLQQFLAAENISQSQFADEIGVARASISHILAGRNKPGFDFIESMARHYPALNLEWLVLGNGKMYKTATEATPAPVQEYPTPVGNIFVDEEETAGIEPAADILSPAPEPQTTERNTSRSKAQFIKNQRNISRIVIFYDDNTYQELK
ncbi:MAG: helix-turn-helix transcriptional regulator [Bacteroidia bacterium]|nr:helix-turn-helix transcriptional regulator [Bacteroidia bacterium]